MKCTSAIGLLADKQPRITFGTSANQSQRNWVVMVAWLAEIAHVRNQNWISNCYVDPFVEDPTTQ